MPWLFEVRNVHDFNPLYDTCMARIVDEDFWKANEHFDDQHLADTLQDEFAGFRGEELMEGVFGFDTNVEETTEYLISLGMRPLAE